MGSYSVNFLELLSKLSSLFFFMAGPFQCESEEKASRRTIESGSMILDHKELNKSLPFFLYLMT